jgi:hypothetical protein
MTEPMQLETLTDREVLLVLSHLTNELQESADRETSPVTSAPEAREALAAFLNHFGPTESAAPDAIVPDDANAAAIGRELLADLVHDQVAGDTAQALVKAPPDDTQMSLELAIGAAIVLGMLITWLQTKVDISVKHERGETSWHFKLHKDAADPTVIKDVVGTVSKLVTPGLPQTGSS